MMLEESEAAEVIRKQRAISFARRPTPSELLDPQIEGAQAEVRRKRALNRGTGNECPRATERRVEGWGAERGDECERGQKK